jgi:hypothetical protein
MAARVDGLFSGWTSIRVPRALETFVASDTYRYWMDRFERDPLPVRAALGPSDGPVDRRELASSLRRFLAFAIDVRTSLN